MSAGLPRAVLELMGSDAAVVVVTPTERLAREVRIGFDEAQRAAGQAAWRSATALSWNGWLRAAWQELLVRGGTEAPLLSRVQEQRLWRSIVGRSEGAGVNAGALAGMAGEALQRLGAYDGLERWARERTGAEGDAARFGVWCAELERWTAERQWTVEAAVPTRLSAAMGRGYARGRRLLLYGMGDLLPAQRRVLEAWRRAGGVWSAVELPEVTPTAEPVLVRVDEGTAELRLCARWAAERLRSGGTARPRIGVVVTDLAGEREELEAALREELAGDGREEAFELSLGRALAAEPVVRCALLVLQLAGGALGSADLQEALLSPYFGATGAGERGSRAELLGAMDRKERRLRPERGAAAVRTALQRLGFRERLPLLYGQLGVLERSAVPDGTLTVGGWADWVRRTLVEAGWLQGAGGLSSREYQVVQRWESAMEAFAGLGVVTEEEGLGWAAAMEELRLVLEGTVFAPEARGAAIQVVGWHEAMASRFDAAWVLRAHDNGWPGRAAASPLLPFPLQRELGMPGTEAARDRGEVRREVERVRGSAAEVIFSYAGSTGLGTEQGPAPMLEAERLRPRSAGEVVAPKQAAEPVACEEFEEEAWVTAPVPTPLPGGVHVLELQAACGFQAFAEARLGSKVRQARDLGLNAGERGSLVHAVLDAFWGEVRDHATLMGMDGGAVERALGRHIDAALARAVVREEADGWERAYVEVQRTRLLRLLRSWMAFERTRPAFRVLEMEKNVQGRIGELELTLRIDRVDEDVATGQRVVMDYKTGTAMRSLWEGERPDLPQVPVYLSVLQAAAEPEVRFGGAAFGLVQAGEGMGLNGLLAEGLVPGGRRGGLPAEELAERFAAWNRVVHQLADEVAGGDARVRPKNFPKTCDRCAQRLLCRVDAAMLERLLAEEGEDESGGGDG